jgi:outer membrane protein OmpA-like peptidoglycan-associated protein
MEYGATVRKSVVGAMLALGTVTLTVGCASKKYVRTEVDTSSKELSSRIDNNQSAIKSTDSQVSELNNVTRDHGQKLNSLDNNVKQVDSKAQQAMSAGQNAQNTANKAVTDVSSLDTKFQNRNHYAVLNQEQVRFKFNSAKLDDQGKKVLDDVAQKLKENPDAILVMEGHTDSVGPDDYNIQLGQKRLESVTRYLVVDQEVPMNRISDLSFGKAKPVNPNKGKDARAENRSVVVRVMGPQLTGQEGMVSQSRESETNQTR